MSRRPPQFRCRRCGVESATLHAASLHHVHAHPGAAPKLDDLRPDDLRSAAPALEAGTGCVLVTCPDCGGRIGYRPGAKCACGWKPIPAVAS